MGGVRVSVKPLEKYECLLKSESYNLFALDQMQIENKISCFLTFSSLPKLFNAGEGMRLVVEGGTSVAQTVSESTWRNCLAWVIPLQCVSTCVHMCVCTPEQEYRLKGLCVYLSLYLRTVAQGKWRHPLGHGMIPCHAGDSSNVSQCPRGVKSSILIVKWSQMGSGWLCGMMHPSPCMQKA